MSPDKIFERHALFAELRGDFSRGEFPEVESDAGSGSAYWFSAAEQQERARWNHASRRNAWSWGRVLSKQLLIDTFPNKQWSPNEISILSHDKMWNNGTGRGKQPDVFVTSSDGTISALPGCLSISHSERAVSVAWSAESSRGIGVDLVDFETTCISPGMISLWFSPEEQQQLEESQKQLQEDEQHERLIYWAVKEAVFKACQCGESFAPRSVQVLPHADFEMGASENTERLFSARYHGKQKENGRDEIDVDCRVRVRQYDGHFLALAVCDELLSETAAAAVSSLENCL